MLPLLPVIVDVLAALFVWLLLDTAVSQLTQFSTANAAIVVVAFLLMCAGVLLVRKLEARDAGGKLTVPLLFLNRKLHILSAVVFALLVTFMVTMQLGYFDAMLPSLETAVPLQLQEPKSAFYWVTPLIILALSFVYLIVLVRKMVPTIDVGNGRYPWLAALALLLINLMLLLTTAQIATWIQLQSLQGDMFLGLIVFGLLALSFGPPRWIYLSKQPDIGGDLSSLALWVFCAWMILR